MHILCSRNFWWGRNGYRGKFCTHNAGYHKSLVGRQHAAETRSTKTIQRASLWLKDSPLFRYNSGQGWRLASSWENSGSQRGNDGPLNNKSKGVEKRQNEWRNEYQKRQDEIAQRFEELKRRIEDDPFGMLFGRELQRGVWNPWGTLDGGLKDVADIKKFESQSESKASTNTRSDEAKISGSKQEEFSTQLLGHNSFGLKSRNSTRAEISPTHNCSAKSRAPPYAPADKIDVSEEYDIDPISNRKIVKRQSSRSVEMDPATNDIISVTIHSKGPMERESASELPHLFGGLKPPTSTEQSNTITRTPMADSTADSAVDHSKHWLAQEGFGTNRQDMTGSTPVSEAETRAKRVLAGHWPESAKTESSLDQGIRDRRSDTNTSEKGILSLQFDAEENRTEDIDLLRASDVRASSGHSRPENRTHEEQKKLRREKLENDYKSRPQALETRYAEEIAAQKARDEEENNKKVDPSYVNEVSIHESPTNKTDISGYTMAPHELDASRQHMLPKHQVPTDGNLVARKADLSTSRVNGSSKNLQGYVTPFSQGEENRKGALDHRRKAAAEDRLAAEVVAHKEAMATIESRKDWGGKSSRPAAPIHLGEGDMPPNVHEFAGRDRWYKNKAPHANERERQIQVDREQQQSRDQELVREIRLIYENTYGIIDMKHRQGGGANFMEGKEDIALQHALKEYDVRAVERTKSSSSHEKPPGASHVTEVKDQVEYVPLAAKDARSKVVTRKEKLRNTNGPLDGDSLQETIDKISKRLCELEAIYVNESKAAAGNNSPQKIPPSFSSTYTQPVTKAPSSSQPLPESISLTQTNTYKIVAYDNSIQDVKIANLSAAPSTIEMGYQTSLSPTEVLFNLSYPAKFLPHFSSLQEEGFDLISGSGDILVFKKVRSLAPVVADVIPQKPQPQIEEKIAQEPEKQIGMPRKVPRPINPIDGTTTQTGNFASPTGYVNLDSHIIYPPPQSQGPQNVPSHQVGSSAASGEKVHREEDVFSGSPRSSWQNHEYGSVNGYGNGNRGEWSKKARRRAKGRLRRAARRVFWGGAWVAGCVYVVGVATEFFRRA